MPEFRWVFAKTAFGLFTALALHYPGSVSAQSAAPLSYDQVIPAAVRGPFVSHPHVVAELDCPAGQCGGPLDFSRLLLARAQTSPMKNQGGGNAFKLKIAAQVLSLIEQDLDDLAKNEEVTGHQINKRFLTDENSSLELVGIINRMDRQFIKDKTQGLTPQQLACGEISLIYRFGYSLKDRNQKSRLPVTLNMIFPALPSDTKGGTITCQMMAQRWLNAIPWLYPADTAVFDAKKVASDLLDPKIGPLAFITGRDMLRLELNIQAYRKPAQIVQDFGTEAAYVLRVFRWLPDKGYFDPDVLRNQIDRDKVLCDPKKPDECAANEQRRKRLVAFLSQPDTMQSLDWGTLEIDYGLGVLAKRGISISPGGSHRSNNQPYWNAKKDADQVISDDEIDKAFKIADKNKIQFSFIKSKEDFRTRLNESTCTGCHQTRAIAGFHFPGADRDGTSAVNSILLPGSPQFYGDQPRRLEILRKIAGGGHLIQFDLASSYAARPMNRFRIILAGTQLIGGWGGACLVDAVRTGSQRQWTCQDGLDCVQLFQSRNDPGIGTCVPANRTGTNGNASPRGDILATQIGDAVQRGCVTTDAFGGDHYTRTAPKTDNMLIPPTALPADPPPGNSYYGSHQEYHGGVEDPKNKVDLRDAKTGGFPAGMLRLSECLGLPDHATCGLIASTGFNDCIKKLGTDEEIDSQKYTIDICFTHFTSYAGMRACDASSPCRDDYICVKPMGYQPSTAQAAYRARDTTLRASKFFEAINRHPYKPQDYYGQTMPDPDWVKRNDQRGLCIPPYFVFQFRADGHPAPKE